MQYNFQSIQNTNEKYNIELTKQMKQSTWKRIENVFLKKFEFNTHFSNVKKMRVSILLVRTSHIIHF